MYRIKFMLVQKDQVYDDPLRVNFTDFADDEILVKMHPYIKTTNFTNLHEVAERLNFRIMDIVRGEGANPALPGRSIHLEGESA
jgi:MscS family membrane protein